MSRLRYLAGKSFFSILDAGLASGLLPFAARFPVGIRFRHDLSRFLGHAPSFIVDAGANVGQSALYFSRMWPGATIWSLEPVAGTYRSLVENTRSNGRIRCIHAALGNRDGRGRMRLHANSELNHLVMPATDREEPPVPAEDVDVRTLDGIALVEGIGRIDLLKIDTEGSELRVLEGAGGLLGESRIRAVYAECKFVRNESPHVLFEDIDRHLTDRGFFFSGFYEMYRWGPQKRFAAFANGLWLLKDAS